MFRGIIQAEAVARRCSVKKVLLEISQNLQENTSARVSFLIKLQAACNFAKLPRTPFLNNTSGGCFCSGLLMWEFFLWSLRPLSRGEVYGDKKYYDRSEAYSEPCRISTMKVFFENSWRLKVVNYFHWKIHLIYLTWFWIRLCKWSRKVAKYIFLFITGLLFLENW